MGGTVRSTNDSVVLTASRGAVPRDTTITVNVLSPAAGTLTSVYDFGPDGTRFTTPVQLAVRLTAPVPQGSRAVLAFNQGGTWAPLLGSQVVDGVVQANVRHFTQYSVITAPVAPATSFARLYHYAALTQTAYNSVDLYLTRGSSAPVRLATQTLLSGGTPAEIPMVTAGETATFFIVPTGMPPSTTPLWSQMVTLAPGQLYQVVTDTASTTPPRESRGITASLRVDDVADLRALTSRTLRITLVPDGHQPPAVHLFDTSQTPPVGVGDFDPSLTIDVSSPAHRVLFGLEIPGSGASGLTACFDLNFADALSMTDQPLVWLFIGSNPRQATASDSIATFDLGNGHTVTVSPVQCPH